MICAGLVIVGVVAYKMTDLNRMNKELVILTAATFEGGNLVVNVTFQNPTNGSIRVKHPFVTMYTTEEKQKLREPFISSKVENKDYQIAPYAETKVKIVVPLSLGQLIAVPELASQYLSGGKVSIIVETVTTLNGKIPYNKVDKMQFGKPAKSIAA